MGVPDGDQGFLISNIKGQINGHYSQLKPMTLRSFVFRNSKNKSSKQEDELKDFYYSVTCKIFR